MKRILILLLCAILTATGSVAEAFPERLDDSVLLSFYDDSVFFGDSITEQLARFRRQQNEENPDYLRNFKIISSSGISLFSGTRRSIIPGGNNFSYNGTELSMYEIAKYLKAPRIFVQLGHNDLIGYKIDKGIEMVRFAIKAVHEMIPETEVYFFSYTPITAHYCEVEKAPDYQDRINEYNERLKETCEECGAHYIDISEPLKGEDGFLIPAYSSDTLFHLNDDGLEVWIHTLCDYAQSQYESGAWTPGYPE